jgi:hypothetical protein
MTTGGVAFWIYLGAFVNMGGGAGLVLGVIARFAARPYDTPLRLRAFLGLLVIVALIGIVASALSYNLTSTAHAFASLRVVSLIWPFLVSGLIFIWASGFPLSRIFSRRS